MQEVVTYYIILIKVCRNTVYKEPRSRTLQQIPTKDETKINFKQYTAELALFNLHCKWSHQATASNKDIAERVLTSIKMKTTSQLVLAGYFDVNTSRRAVCSILNRFNMRFIMTHRLHRNNAYNFPLFSITHVKDKQIKDNQASSNCLSHDNNIYFEHNSMIH